MKKTGMKSAICREEIAVAAARLIADSGLDWNAARRKAGQQLSGMTTAISAAQWPDDALLETALASHHALFHSDTQPAQCHALRVLALQCMEWLADFQPYLLGPVWRGTANKYTPIVLQLYTDSTKEVAIFLINAGIDYVSVDVPDPNASANARSTTKPRKLEGMMFEWQNCQITLVIHDTNVRRSETRMTAGGDPLGANAASLKKLLNNLSGVDSPNT